MDCGGKAQPRNRFGAREAQSSSMNFWSGRKRRGAPLPAAVHDCLGLARSDPVTVLPDFCRDWYYLARTRNPNFSAAGANEIIPLTDVGPM